MSKLSTCNFFHMIFILSRALATSSQPRGKAMEKREKSSLFIFFTHKNVARESGSLSSLLLSFYCKWYSLIAKWLPAHFHFPAEMSVCSFLLNLVDNSSSSFQCWNLQNISWWWWWWWRKAFIVVGALRVVKIVWWWNFWLQIHSSRFVHNFFFFALCSNLKNVLLIGLIRLRLWAIFLLSRELNSDDVVLFGSPRRNPSLTPPAPPSLLCG